MDLGGRAGKCTALSKLGTRCLPPQISACSNSLLLLGDQACGEGGLGLLMRAYLVFALFPGPTPGPGLLWCALELGKRVAGYTSGVTAPAVQLCEQRMAQYTACTQKGLLWARSWARLSEWMNC